MPGRFHTAVFNVYSDELRKKMDDWLTEQSANGWEIVSVAFSPDRHAPQALVVVRRDI